LCARRGILTGGLNPDSEVTNGGWEGKVMAELPPISRSLLEEGQWVWQVDLHMHIKQIFCAKLLLFIVPLLAWSVGTAGVVSSSDDYEVQVWDTDSGLPHSTVTGVVQTPDGYIWIGTLRGGLARFDGSHFVNFHPGNTPELSSIEIFKLLVDDKGNALDWKY
jgi:hypothetical protein